MFRPHFANIPLLLEPTEFAALRIAVDAGVSLREHDFRLAVPVDVADRYDGRDIVLRVLMPFPHPLPILVPTAPENDLVLAVPVDVYNGQTLFRLVLDALPLRNKGKVRPGTDKWVLRQWNDAELGAALRALVPKDQRESCRRRSHPR